MMYVIVVMIVSTLLFVFLCKSVLRKKTALVQWISRLIGKRTVDNPCLTDSTTDKGPKTSFKSAKQKSTKRGKLIVKSTAVGVSAILDKESEPKIEDNIEVKGRKRNKPKKVDKEPLKTSEDQVGFSFFRTKSQIINSTESASSVTQKGKNIEYAEIEDVDQVGFSFIPVKEKKPKKSKVEKSVNEPSLTKINKRKNNLKEFTNSTKLQILTKSTSVPTFNDLRNIKSSTVEQSKQFSSSNIQLSSVSKFKEEKESKKVISTVSYAQVASNQADFDVKVDVHVNCENNLLINDKYLNKDIENELVNDFSKVIDENKKINLREISEDNSEILINESKFEAPLKKNDQFILNNCDNTNLIKCIEEIENFEEIEDIPHQIIESKQEIENNLLQTNNIKDEIYFDLPSETELQNINSYNTNYCPLENKIIREDSKEKTLEFLQIENEINSLLRNSFTEANQILKESDRNLDNISNSHNFSQNNLLPNEEFCSEKNYTHTEIKKIDNQEYSYQSTQYLQLNDNSQDIENVEIQHTTENLEPVGSQNLLASSITEKKIIESEVTKENDQIINELISSSIAEVESILIEKEHKHELNNFEIINTNTDLQKDNLETESFKAIDTEIEMPHKIMTLSNNLEIPKDAQVRILEINKDEFKEGVLYRIEKDWIIQFRLGPSLFGKKVNLYCNYPLNGVFDRQTYYLVPWSQDVGCENSDDTAIEASIKCNVAGSFHYYFTFSDSPQAEQRGAGFFLVDPVIKYGKNEDLPLDCIQCQTVISKNLGSFSSWENKLRVSKESGYNMIHFTPIQELGKSNSAYSLKEQLKLNKTFKKDNGEMPTFDEVKRLISKMRSEWKVVSICDIVLNHTANESAWIQEHPEVTYNCSNCSYLRPAYLLDSALHQFSMDVKNGLYETKGIPPLIETEDHLNAIRYHLHQYLLSLKFEEMFICDVNKYVTQFLDIARQNTVQECQSELQHLLKLHQDPEYKRLGSTIDMNIAIKVFNGYRLDCFDEDARIRKCCEEFKRHLDSLNQVQIDKINSHLQTSVDNTVAGIRYHRVQHDGPKFKEITESRPLTYRYFTDFGNPTSLQEHENSLYSKNSQFLMAHNGWVMNSDPLTNFAGPDSTVYIRRELIAWGDSVKLRFGDKPEDCPFLWKYMKQYVEKTAEVFDGVRLDNCHSTPIHVAEYLLDCARKIRPNLYVAAELFTNSDNTDNIFVNHLGISSLIREALSAWDSHEQGRLVYRYGGIPVGSFYQPNVRPLVPSVAHALFLDLTHDNPSSVEKRSVFDMLPSTALVNMACCASGSNRGYDELVPHHIHVVDETREYTEWTSDKKIDSNAKYVNFDTGIIKAKKALNDLHFYLGSNGFNQVYVDQMDSDIVAVTRHCPKTHQSYILVAFTAFTHPNIDADKYQRPIKPLVVEGDLNEIVLEATLSYGAKEKYNKVENFTQDSKYINGYSEYELDIKQHIKLSESNIFEQVKTEKANLTCLNFKNFKPGSIVIIKVCLPETVNKAIKDVRGVINKYSVKDEKLYKIIQKLDFNDLNRVLYKCGQEERDDGKGFDAYTIPNFSQMVYAGLQGFMSLLSKIRPSNDLGHPMCNNLRDGNWMIDFIWQRLINYEKTEELGEWIKENTVSLKMLPRYLIPAYFDMIVTGLYVLLMEHAYSLYSPFIRNGSIFVKALAMGSIQFAGFVKSADLPVLSPNLAPPKPPTRLDTDGKVIQACVSLSAGLPHFSVGYMRNWGRDTFIALRGLFILTGRYQDARYHLLAYGACLRHGLIPNLLDGGRNSRYNCRDAVWWWLYCIKCYTEEVPSGLNILKDNVSRIFPSDDSEAQAPGKSDQTLEDVIQEALNVHFQGLVFRERNAGRQIDEHMVDNGFNNQIGVHPSTGFVFGGNVNNCGTWMDKMGSSDKAGNRGQPATPRDGSACEIIGLSKCAVTWLADLHQKKQYKYEGVERKTKNGDIIKWTYKEWALKIKENFEKYFWVNDKPLPDEICPELINKRGIYKDCYGASQAWSDYQLRCNFPIVMVVAPELFNPEHAWIALEQAERHLVGPLGMKTLDPADWAYRGDYDNSNDSSDSSVAHGFNYHQGPEWVWPIGFYLRAKLLFASKNNKLPETIASIKDALSKHFTELQNSDWKGLPELTNSKGSYCNDSSRTQAWSMSCILEVLHDLQKVESKL